METWKTQYSQEWDKELYKKAGHFLQSSAWGEFQKALGKQVFFGQGEGWQCLAIIERTKFGDRIYCPYGPTCFKKSSFKDAIKSLEEFAREKGAIYLRIEPVGDFELSGLIKSDHDIQPTLSWVKDLSKTQEELIAEMSATNRNLHRTASKKGLSFRVSEDPKDIKIFLDMIHDVAKHTGITPHDDSYYTKMAEVLLSMNAAKIYTADFEDSPIAAAFVFESLTTRYYAHAGALSQYRKLHAGSPLLTQMILDAKESGRKEFDFVGVSPPDQPNHKWAGFSKFKKSFGGDYKAYAGTWEIPIKKLKYLAYRASLKATKVIKR